MPHPLSWDPRLYPLLYGVSMYLQKQKCRQWSLTSREEVEEPSQFHPQVFVRNLVATVYSCPHAVSHRTDRLALATPSCSEED
jgi:hypothetical protein